MAGAHRQHILLATVEVGKAAVAGAAVAHLRVAVGSPGSNKVVLSHWGGPPGHQRTAVPAGRVHHQVSWWAGLFDGKTIETHNRTC